MKQKLKFDDVIELLGGFGMYQKRLYLLVVIPAMWCAIMTIITVFTVGEQDHRCKIPGLANDSYKHHDVYTNNSAPKLFDEECSIVVNITGNVTKKCDSWVYDTSVFTSTLVSEFDLVCDRKILQSHASMGIFAGALVGSALFGTIGDIFGRKIATCLSLMFMFGAHLGTVFIPNYFSFIIMRFISGIGNIGYWNSAVILSMEMASPKKRVWTGMLIEVAWATGEYLTVFVAYFVRQWRHLQLVFAAPIGLFLIYWKILDESPRWLVNKGRKEEAGKILTHIAKVNKTEKLPEDIEVCEDDQPIKGSFLVTIRQVLRSRVMVIRTLIMLFNWITVNAGYYGLTLNSGKIGGDIFVNFTVSVTMEIIAYILCIVFLDRIGRRTLHCSCMIIGGISCLCSIFPVIFGNETHQWIIITLSMIGKLGISAAFADIYFLSAELFPTSIRSFILGLSCIFGRCGSLASPYIADLGLLIESSFGKALPLLVFGSMMLGSGFMALTLPETMNKKMPETIEDALALKRNKSFDRNNPEVCMELTKEHLLA
ncbi:organic cation transporter protein-like [Mytilus edulis]|uniref:organic cation transporter protein-like n=1 Tax=Mytilus edulis TaxID=6550 RepID=UPI0039EE26B3